MNDYLAVLLVWGLLGLLLPLMSVLLSERK